MIGVYGSSIVIDEIIDCFGMKILEDKLESITLDILPHKNLTVLTPHVFDVLARKCSNLKKFELRGTQKIKSENARGVLHNFFSSVVSVCDPAKLTDLRMIKMGRTDEEVVDLLEQLTASEIKNLQVLAID